MELTHLNKQNNPTMVDVSNKDITTREAYASGVISMSEQAFEAAINHTGKKGSITQTAIIAAIMGSKKTSKLIPMCHPLMINKINEKNIICDVTEENGGKYGSRNYQYWI